MIFHLLGLREKPKPWDQKSDEERAAISRSLQAEAQSIRGRDRLKLRSPLSR
jgi:hypothetical protein